MSASSIRVPGGLHTQSRFFAATAGIWKKLGDIETSVLADDLATVKVQQPIYVTSLARAGTTIVTELLEQHPDVSSHHYSDFPNPWTPYWRNYLLQKTRKETPRREERAHKDRIEVSNDSSEAVEEVLWAHFFDGLHDEQRSQVLGYDQANAAFDNFYSDHIRKLLLARSATRYLAKGNYNIARLQYLHRLFPDARFVIPLRQPINHIASLAKQHQLFLEADKEDPRVARQLAMSGHFEFGPQRTFVHFGDYDAATAIRTAWNNGQEVEGWARYWQSTYLHLARQLAENEALRNAVMLVPYETLCERSEEVIEGLLAHCQLDADSFKAHKAEYARRLSLPDYYQPQFSGPERDLISGMCQPALDALSPYVYRPV